MNQFSEVKDSPKTRVRIPVGENLVPFLHDITGVPLYRVFLTKENLPFCMNVPELNFSGT